VALVLSFSLLALILFTFFLFFISLLVCVLLRVFVFVGFEFIGKTVGGKMQQLADVICFVLLAYVCCSFVVV